MKNSAKKSIIVLSLLAAYQQSSIAAPVDINTVLATQQSWNGQPLPSYNSGQPEFRIMRFKIAPGAKTPIHLHPVNGGGFITAGTLTMYATLDPHGKFNDAKQIKKITLTAGQAWTESVNTWHYGENNGDKPVEFVVVFAGQKGTPPTLALSK